MKKFEVCIRGKNFLINRDGHARKHGFYAVRFVEANDMSDALEIVMGGIKTELKGAVLNDKSDPPAVNVDDIYEVFYFQDTVEYKGKSILPEGFVWE
ncbi:MAG: hypothetical protein HZA08_03735 [Nitrospirae bacterium]|nr:hypothetical protein [Nitrospirota bacterium]